MSWSVAPTALSAAIVRAIVDALFDAASTADSARDSTVTDSRARSGDTSTSPRPLAFISGSAGCIAGICARNGDTKHAAREKTLTTGYRMSPPPIFLFLRVRRINRDRVHTAHH